MKKGLAIILVFAVIFAFAACTKNPENPEAVGETYVAPPTEILSFENGSTAVYEVVTDTSGVAVTDENGENQVIPYDPPVTEKEGVLVTDAAGSTIKQSATTVAQSVAVENAIIDLDEPTQPAAPTGTTPAATTAAGVTGNNETAVSAAPSQPTTVTDSGEIVLPDNDPAATTGSAVTTVPATKPSVDDITTSLSEAVTYPFNGELSKEDAQKLLSIVSIDNRFDEALCQADYETAAKELPIYIEDIKAAIEKIKADKDLYAYVGDENLNAWLSYMLQAEEEFAVFLGIHNGIAGQTGEPPRSYYVAYETFQSYYKQSLKTFYHIKIGAQEIIYS